MFSKIVEFFTHEDRNLRDNRWIFVSMLIGAIASLIAAFALSVEAYELAGNSEAIFSCDINAVISCGTVARTAYSTMFGFPNSYLGLISEPVVITVAVAGLAGVKFPRKFMFAAQIGYALGFLFAYYLFAIGLTQIHAVCPWCMVVTLATTFVFFSISRYNIREDNLYLPKKISKKAKQFIKKDYDKLILFLLTFVLFALLILNYGGKLIGN